MKNIKCVVVGDEAVGKTALIDTYREYSFLLDHIPTVFNDHSVIVNYNQDCYILDIYDTAGNRDYERLRPLSYPYTNIFIVCFSVDDRNSFKNVSRKWLPELSYYCPNVPVILIGTKTDLREKDSKSNKRYIKTKCGQKLAEDINAVKYVECSVYNRVSILIP